MLLHVTLQRNYHKQTFLMMLIYLPTIVHNQSLLWWNVNRIQKVMQSCKKKGWWIEGSLRFFWHNAKASKLLSTNALITKWNFYGWEKHSKCEKNVIKHHTKISYSTQCLKIIQNVAFNIASEASYVCILRGQKFTNSWFWHYSPIFNLLNWPVW